MVNEYQENYGTGWISLYRSVQKHWIFDNDKYFKWWIIMLFEANHQDKKLVLGYEVFEIKKGQSANSLRTWARLFNTGTKSVTKFFKMLEKDSMITKETIGKGKQSTTLINIDNYGTYQGSKETQRDTQGDTLRERKGYTNNNVNNVNKEIIYRKFAHLKLTESEFKNLNKDYTKEQIDYILDAIENYSKNKSYKSLNLTAQKWLRKEYPKQKTVEKNLTRSEIEQRLKAAIKNSKGHQL
jgi:hypothetical protein